MGLQTLINEKYLRFDAESSDDESDESDSNSSYYDSYHSDSSYSESDYEIYSQDDMLCHVLSRFPKASLAYRDKT